MSKLFEITNQLNSLIELLEVDPDTGEIRAENPDMVFAQIDMLTQEKDEIISYLVEQYQEKKYLEKTVEAKIEDLRKQKERLKKRQESLLSVIDRECGGKNRDFGFATVNYRKASSTVIDNEDVCLAFCKDNGLENCFTTKTETKLNKTELKKQMMLDTVPGAHIETITRCSVR